MNTSNTFVFVRETELINRDDNSGRLTKNIIFSNMTVGAYAYVVDPQWVIPDRLNIEILNDDLLSIQSSDTQKKMSDLVYTTLEAEKRLIPSDICYFCGKHLFFSTEMEDVRSSYCVNINCANKITINRLSWQLWSLTGIVVDKLVADIIKQYYDTYRTYPDSVFDLIGFALGPVAVTSSNDFRTMLLDKVRYMDTVKFFELAGMPTCMNQEDISITGIPLEYIVASVVQLMSQSDFNYESVRHLICNMVTDQVVLDYMTRAILASDKAIIAISNLRTYQL